MRGSARATPALACARPHRLGASLLPLALPPFPPPQEKGYVTADVAKAEGLTTLSLSGTKFRQMLRGGEDIPE
jgi:ATP sulfurylase